MEKAENHQLGAWLFGTFGLILFLGGLWLMSKYWAILQTVNAGGSITQAFAIEEYTVAVERFRLSIVGTGMGFIMILIALVSEIQKTLWKIQEEG